MSFAPGTLLGAYAVTSALRAGGMGEVFRSRDARLNRDVAIKVFPAAFADDPERLARFTREAQTLASLNHPNIAGIHGIEEIPAVTGSTTSGSRALVMELVLGEDLSAHIARGPIPVAEALPIARQIAEALEAAHEQGIVHRDLRPANIKLRADGTVTVLDFGLTKAMDPAGASSSNSNISHSPTLTHQGTMAGMIIGTAAYMAPEQAKGKPVDRRADIWAVGVVLYEMLTGKRAFKGDDVSETLASVLKDTLSMDALPKESPDGRAGFSVSDAGVLAYKSSSGAQAALDRQLTWIDRSGKVLEVAGRPGRSGFPGPVGRWHPSHIRNQDRHRGDRARRTRRLERHSHEDSPSGERGEPACALRRNERRPAAGVRTHDRLGKARHRHSVEGRR